jgi:hypothetical protein
LVHLRAPDVLWVRSAAHEPTDPVLDALHEHAGAAMNVAATMTLTLTPGTVISRLISDHDSLTAINFSTSAICASRRATWRTAESTVSRSVTGNCCSASQWRPLAPNRSHADGRPLRQRINTASISFFA